MTEGSHGDLASFISSAASPAVTERVTMNVKQVWVVVTEDKIRLCLQQRITEHVDSHAKTVELARIKQSWQAPLGILLSVVLAFATANFVDAFSVSKDSWRALFILVAMTSAGWLAHSIWSIVAAYWNRPELSKPSTVVDNIVIDLQQAAQAAATGAGQAPKKLPEQ